MPTLLLIWLALDLLLALLPTLTSARTASRSRLIDLDGRIEEVEDVVEERYVVWVSLLFLFALHSLGLTSLLNSD